MSMMQYFKAFRADESGAITVDWVVLTATILFLGIASAFFVTSGVPVLADRVGAYLSTAQIGPEQ